MPRHLRVLTATLLCGVALLLPTAPVQAALPATETQRIVSDMLKVLDDDSPAQALRDIARYREAGFVYQPALAVSEETCPTENEDQRAVLSGMVAADRAFAFFFGKPEDATRENLLFQTFTDRSGKIPLLPLCPDDYHTLRNEPHSARARAIWERCRNMEYAYYVEEAKHDEGLLRLLSAHIYGIYIERLYMTSVMVLAAAESDQLEPLFLVHQTLASHHGKALELLGKGGVLGESPEENRRRAVLVKRLQGLLVANKGRPTLDSLREIVTLTQEERAIYLTPCPLP